MGNHPSQAPMLSLPLHLNRQQWLVFLAAWLGWGLDISVGLLFNFVAPHAVPSLLGLTVGSPAAKSATLGWTGVITALLLFSWAINRWHGVRQGGRSHRRPDRRPADRSDR